MTDKKKKYGVTGWREFRANRMGILAEFDRAQLLNASHPVKTSHGVAGEAVVRHWLKGFLPKKYGVTSGYVLPTAVVDDYSLYAFDVIVFDALSAPVLFSDSNYDLAPLGRKRAVPAKYVLAVFEVKATVRPNTATEATSKLASLNELASELHEDFSSYTLFFQITDSEVNKQSILKNLMPNPLPFAYCGGAILRTADNADQTGLIDVFEKNEKMRCSLPLAEESWEKIGNDESPLAFDVNQIIARDPQGQHTAGQFRTDTPSVGGMIGGRFYASGEKWHLSKQYFKYYLSGDRLLRISWSHNGFAYFVRDLLRRLDGRSFVEDEPVDSLFGLVFDRYDE